MIRAGSGGWEGLEHHRLFESEFTPMASPDCIAIVERKLGRKLEPSDLPDQNRISPSDEWWQQWFSDNGVPADERVLKRPGIRLENQANEGHAAMGGQGFALLTPLLWKGDVAAGRLADAEDGARRAVTLFPDETDFRAETVHGLYLEFLVRVHAAEGAAVVGTPEGDLEDKRVCLAGRAKNISFVKHECYYSRSRIFEKRGEGRFFRCCLKKGNGRGMRR